MFVARSGEIWIAGSFAGPAAAVELDATSLCRCEPGTCWHGFNAHLSKYACLRYRPLGDPLVEVALGGGVSVNDSGRGWVGHTQQVLRAELPYFCPFCALTGLYRAPAPVLGVSPGDGVLEIACEEHLRSVTIKTRDVPVPVTWTSELLGQHLARRSEAVTRPGCACRTVAQLSAERGLRYYFRDLWDGGAQTAEGYWLMTCRVCGQAWRYYRDDYPGYAVRDDPSRPLRTAT